MSELTSKPKRLMAPGPVPLPPKVLKVLGEPMIHHRTPEFEAVLRRVLTRLKDVFLTRHPVLLHTATGSGAMESAVVNILSPGDRALFVVSGKFGERWLEQALAYGVKAEALNVPWGAPVGPRTIAEYLKAHPDTKAVYTQVCETSTATLHPIREIAAQMRAVSPNTLLAVDAITALGATPFEMDNWNIDVAVAGSQKAFMLPTGLSMIALSDRAWKAYKTARCPRHYFDLGAELKANQNGDTRFSSAVSLIRALDVALDDLTGAHLVKQIGRCQKLAQATREAAGELGLSVYSQSPSPSVTALVVPAHVDGAKLREHIEVKYAVTIMGGQDQLKGRILRVGHLGYIENEDQLATIEAIGRGLSDLAPGSVSPQQLDSALQRCRDVLMGAN